MERLSFASLTLSVMTSHKRLKLRQCTNCECVINGVWEWVEECARGAAAEEPAMRGILDDVCLSRNSLATSISARLARKLSRLPYAAGTPAFLQGIPRHHHVPHLPLAVAA